MKSKMISAAAVGVACVAIMASAAGTASAQVALAAPAKTQVALAGPSDSLTSAQVAAPGSGVLTAVPTARQCLWYISGSGVRIRKTPGGLVLGHARNGEKVNYVWESGVWLSLAFLERISTGPQFGWVHRDYVRRAC